MEQARDIATLTALEALERALAAEDAQAIVAACLSIRAHVEPGAVAMHALVAVQGVLARLERGAQGADRRQGYLGQGAAL